MDDFQIRRTEIAGHVITMEDERLSKKVLNGNFILKEQWENQEQEGRMSSGGTYHRS